MTDKKTPVSRQSDVAAFLNQVKQTPVLADGAPARLVFALDATLSRSPTWDQATHLQAEMFEATASLGGLNVQLAYYRGFNEFYASDWFRDGTSLLGKMTGVGCRGGQTQIGRVLKHCLKVHRETPIKALIFIGDAVEESIDALCHLAGQMGVLHIPVFIFQEGHDARVKQAFQELARLSGGAYAPFDLNSADQLKDLLAAVAVYVAGGTQALKKLSQQPAVKLLTQQLKG